MLSIEKIRVAVAGLSITYPLQPNPRPVNRAEQQAEPSPKTMQETLPKDSFPNAPTFDGVSDQMDMPYAPELNPNCFTIEMWVIVGGGTGYQSIIASVGGSPLEGRKGYLFCVTPARQWQFWLGNGKPQAFWQVLSGPPILPDVWTHLAGTYDPRARVMAFYVNGQEVGRQTGVQYQPNDRYPTRIGAGATQQWRASPCFFCGKIAEVHVWDRVLEPREIQALSAQQSIAVQVEPMTEGTPESGYREQNPQETDAKSPANPTPHTTQFQDVERTQEEIASPNPAMPMPEGVESESKPASTLNPTPSTPSPEKPPTPPIVEHPLATQSPTPNRSMSQTPSVLWQIGRPGQAGMSAPTGIWTQVYNYAIGTDSDPLNRPTIPACLVPANASKIPNSTGQLNILFALTEDYTEGQLVLCYDRYGSGDDYLYLDGQLLTSTPGEDSSQLKQSQIPLPALTPGTHTLSITVSNKANSAHVINYLQLQTLKPMHPNPASQFLPPGDPSQSGGNHPTAQNPHQQGQAPQAAGLLGGLLSPVAGIAGQATGLVNQATGAVGNVAGGAADPSQLVGQATGLVGGLAQQATGAVGNVAGGVADPSQLVGQATGLVGGLAQQATGAVGNVAGGVADPSQLVGQATGLVGGLAQQATGAVGNVAGGVADPSQLLAQVAGLLGGLTSQATGVVGNVAGGVAAPSQLLGQATGLVGGLAGQATGAVGPAAGLVNNVMGAARPGGALVPSVLSMQMIAQLAQLISQLSLSIAQMSQTLNQLAIAYQASGVGMSPVPQPPQQPGIPQPTPGNMPAGLNHLSPQQLAQLQQQLLQLYGQNRP